MVCLRGQCCILIGLLLVAVLANAAWGAAADWPQFRGPNRDEKCTETGLLKQWPEGGPKLLWKAEGLGRGFSTVSIVDGKIFTMGDIQKDGQESQHVIAMDLASRKMLWSTRIGPAHPASDGGPRCTPTVDGDLVFAIGTEGDVACLETATGKLVWHKNFADDFGGKMMSMWKFSESPTIDGDRLVCTPGANDAVMVALNKKTGELIWKCAMPDLGRAGKDGAGYCTPVIAEIEGVRQYVQLVGRGMIGVEAASGKFLWGYNRIANPVANVTTPNVQGNLIFCSTSYRTGSALVKITRSGDEFKAEEVYFLGAREFSNHHGGVVLVGDYLYGGDGLNQGKPCCLEFQTGKMKWKERPLGKRSACVLYADGQLYYRYEDGLVALVDATPDGLKVKGQFKPAEVQGIGWAYPVIHDGKLYLRDQDILNCYDIRQK